MTFRSILSPKLEENGRVLAVQAPDFFGDLNLDQVVDAITARKKDYDLKPFFYTPLHDVDTIVYRHEVMQDMQDPALMSCIKAFAEKMVIVRRYLALLDKLYSHLNKEGWFLEAALAYCEAITELGRGLGNVGLKSRGLLAFSQYVMRYIQTPGFQLLQSEAQKVKSSLSDVKYCIIVQAGKFKVRKYLEEADYSVEVLKIFEKFKQGAVKDYRLQLNEGSGMNHIEAQILDFVARLYPEQFSVLDQFCQQHSSFIDETIRIFDREIQFYIAYLEFIAEIQHRGLKFCYPKVSPTNREEHAEDSFDLALARILIYNQKPVICNDFRLEDPERIIVVSGPNQGGKTTFARMFGQLHYLASLGCPVPGTRAQLFLCDQIYAHFEREENIHNLRGKLQDDLVRIHKILEQIRSNSILILNEIFASTTLKDAVFLSKEILAKVSQLDLLCVWVTFIDELSWYNEKTISMVSTIVPENPAVRTFKIIRQPADGLAYAHSMAKKHHLTYEQIKERIQS